MFSRILTFSLIFISNLSIGQTNPWVLSSEKSGMKVYFRESAESDVKELKFTFTVQSSLSALVALIDDVPNYSKWVYKLDDSKIIKKINDQEMLYYNVMDFPWPLTDRDMIAYNKVYQDPQSKIVTSHSIGVPSQLEEHEDFVRIKTVEVKYVLKPNEDGTVTVDYYLKSDPAGNLPAWIINLALEYGPTESIKKFRSMLKEEPYKSASFPFIVEP